MGLCISAQSRPEPAGLLGKLRATSDKSASVQHVFAGSTQLPAPLEGWSASADVGLFPPDMQLSQESGSLRIKSQQGRPFPS